jgi:hypothetical protein
MSKVKALISGFVGFNGVPVLLAEGGEWDAEDPRVLARPDLFTEPPAKPKRQERPSRGGGDG